MLFIDCIEWFDHDYVALLALLCHLHHFLIFQKLYVCFALFPIFHWFLVPIFVIKLIDNYFVPIHIGNLYDIAFRVVLSQSSSLASLHLMFHKSSIWIVYHFSLVKCLLIIPIELCSGQTSVVIWVHLLLRAILRLPCFITYEGLLYVCKLFQIACCLKPEVMVVLLPLGLLTSFVHIHLVCLTVHVFLNL